MYTSCKRIVVVYTEWPVQHLSYMWKMLLKFNY